jgi:hypothetical protein
VIAKNSISNQDLGIVYIISLGLALCIRNSKAALVLTFGVEP